MKSYLKKSIALILSLMMTLSMMPSLVFALDEPLASENIEARVSAEEQTEEGISDEVEEHSENENAEVDKAAEDNQETAAVESSEEDGSEEDTSDEVEEHSENENAEVDKAAEDNQETVAVESSEEDGSEDSDSEISTDIETVKETAPAGEKTEEAKEEIAEEAKEDTAEEVKMPAFNQSKTSDGVKITVKAAEGIFSEGAYLDVRKATEDEAAKTDKAVESKRGDNVNVALTYTFDIKVLDKDGKELQPEEGQKVEVLFTADEVSNENLSPAVYHIKDEGNSVAEALDINEKDDTVSAETDGFSYYTVEFTYGDLQYVMDGDSEIPLSTILDKIGLSGTVTAATSSNPELFSVENNGSDWTVKALQAFCSEETLSLTIDGIDYVVRVTDSQHNHPSGSHGESGAWTNWTSSSSLPTSSGNYYLNTDVTLARSQIPSSGTATIKLCLNGRKITISKGNNGLYDTDSSRNVNLTIYDSDDNSGIITNTSTYGAAIRVKAGSTYTLAGGKITNCNCSAYNAPVYLEAGTFTMKGGMICNNTLTDFAPVYVTGGTFNMSGGTITGNTNKSASGFVASGVHVTSGTFNMSGGSITNNNSPDANFAAGVYFQNPGLFNVKGKVTITGNTSKGKDLNVRVNSNRTIGINGNLDSDSRIGVTTVTAPSGSTTIQFTNGLSGKGSKTNFISDNPDYTVMIKNNEAHLIAHKHEFNYTAEGDTITATCVNMATDCPLEDRTATLKIVAPALKKYGGTESEKATLEGEIPGVTPPAIVYINGPESSTTAPKNAGRYTAEITLTGSDNIDATASVDYTIDKADISPVVNIDGWNYGDTPNEPSVTATSNPGSGTVTYEYYTDEACTQKTTSAQDATVDGGVPSYGGDYWVKATVAETANYNSGTGKKKFTINAKSVKVTGLKYDSKVYDGNTAATLDIREAKLEGVPSTEDVQIDSATGEFDNKNVGTDKTIRNIIIVLKGSKAGGYKATADPVTGAITAKAVKVTGITAADKTYDGNKTATLTFTGAAFEGLVEGDTLSVKGETTQDGTFDNKNVGNGKTVTLPALTLEGNDAANYAISDDSQTTAKAAITAKEVSVTAADKSKTYGDTDPELTYTADGLITGDTFTGALTRDEGEDAGKYDINQGTLSAGDNYTIKYTKGTFTINKAAANSVTASIEGWIYGDTPKTPSATATYGQDTAIFTYSDSKDGDYKSDVPNDAGTWYVKATVPETANYAGAVSEPAEFTIEKKEVGLEWSDTELTYNGNAQKPKATATGLVDRDECDVTVDGAQTDANAKSGTDSYTATAISLSNANYKLPDITTTEFTIAQKEITITGITAEDKTYDGNTDAALDYSSVDYSGKLGSDDVSVTAKGQFDNENAGTDKTVSISDIVLGGEAKDNYVLAKQGQQETATANINKKEIAVTAEDKSKTYLEDDPELMYTADELVTGDSFTGALERAEGEDVGTYDINQGTLTAGDNYTINYTKGTFTINQATTNEVTASNEGWTYGDTPKAPSATATYGQDTVTFAYSDAADGTYTETVPTDAGTWYVKATVPETANYVGAESTPVEFTIAQKEVGLEWADTEFTYNGEAQKPAATATDLVDGDECDVIVAGEETDANAKTGTYDYTATATGLSNDNYKLPENNTTTFTIAPKEITKSMLSVSPAEVKGDGSEQGPTFTMEDQDVSDPAMKEGEDFELTGEAKSSVNGTHFVTVEGKGNYTGSVDTSWMMYNEKSNNEKEPGTDGRGDFEIFVDINQNTEAISVSDFAIDMAKKLLSNEELARYNAGENVTVYLEVLEEPKSAVNSIDKSLLNDQFRTAAAKDIRWFDITVWKKVGNDAAIQVHDTGSDISISIEVPDEYKSAPNGYTREFYFGRAHEGEAAIVKQTADINVSVASHLFSTYAMAYKDTKIPDDKEDSSSGDDGSENNSGGNNSDGSHNSGNSDGSHNSGNSDGSHNSGNSSGSHNSRGVKTGDSIMLIPWITALVCALAAGCALNRRRKNEE